MIHAQQLGECSQCGAARLLVRTRVSVGGPIGDLVPTVERRPCAECLADIVAGAETIAGTRVLVEAFDGSYRQVAR